MKIAGILNTNYIAFSLKWHGASANLKLLSVLTAVFVIMTELQLGLPILE